MTSPSPAVTQCRQLPWHGTTAWEIHAQGARARISAFGGQLLSWQPLPGEEVFWLSDRLAALPTPLRGGVPLCWPWFGRQGQPASAPSHGLARTAPWRLDSQRALADGRLEVVLRPAQPVHPQLEVFQTLVIGRVLEQWLHTINRSSAPFALTQALHTYFAVDVVADAVVQGLEGTAYTDALHPAAPGCQPGRWRFDALRDGGRCDRIHATAGNAVVLERGPGRAAVHVQPHGSHSMVLWTPGPELGQAMADVGAGWADYLCLEVANAGRDVVELLPGQAHALGQTLALQA